MKDLLSKDEILAAFGRLGERAQREGLTVELFIVGGAAVIFAHKIAEDMREGITRDVDAVFVQPQDSQLSKLRDLIGQVGAELNLPNGWLNDSAAKYVTRRSDGPLIFQHKGLIVRRATDLQLLGMKLGLRRRKTDLDDQEVLFDAVTSDLQPSSKDELWSWVERYVPTDRVTGAKVALYKMWESRHG